MDSPRSAALVAGAAIVMAACTSPPTATAPPRPSDGIGAAALSTGSPEAPAGVTSDEEAIRELGEAHRGYEQARDAFAQGNRDAALDFMNTAYLEHFERVEPWLDRRLSRDYREEVEAALSRNLRRRLREGGPDSEITAQFPLALAKIAEAQDRLRVQR